MANEGGGTIISDENGITTICVPRRDSYLRSLGIWVGDNPFDFVIPVTLFQISIFIIVSRVLYILLRPLSTPKFVCYVLGGILVGPSIMGDRIFEVVYPPIQSPILFLLGRIGAAYSVFFIVLKMDIVPTIKAAKKYWKLGSIPFFCSLIVMYTITHHTSLDYRGRLKQPNIHCWTSFSVVSDFLMELNLITTELGQIALSTAVVTEISQWIMLLFYLMKTNTLRFSFSHLGLIAAFLMFLCFVVRPIMKVIIKRTPKGEPVKQGYVIMVLLGVIAMATISDIIGITFIMGPTLYGLFIPNGPPLATTIVERTEVVISEIMMPFFYLTLGTTTRISRITDKYWFQNLIIEAVVLAGVATRVVLTMVIGMTHNIRCKHGFILGLMMSIEGILDLILFHGMMRFRLFEDYIYVILELHALLITAISAPLIKVLYKHHHRISKEPSAHEGRVRTIQSTSLTSKVTIISCIHQEANVHSMIGLLEALNTSQESPLFVHVIHLVELFGKSAPILLPLKKQNHKKKAAGASSSSINYHETNHIMRAFENYSRNSTAGNVNVLSYVNVAPYKIMHASVCNLADQKSVPLILVPFYEHHQIINSHDATFIRDLNISFQQNARCTVGILVDRYSTLFLNASSSCFHVAIFFIGGQDDREALALGLRMLDRTSIKVTLLQFILQHHNDNNNLSSSPGLNSNNNRQEAEEEEEAQRILDECLVDEFKGKMIVQNNADFCEIVVEDSIGVLEAIRGMEMEVYDLVVVGKRHQFMSITDEEMMDFMENADQLGVIGDMLASTEFYAGKISLLVMQCGGKKALDKKTSTNRGLKF
ncbi:hypothetical protein PIB30_059259 [Stylosanthes scabra]|uniref:Cation/H+ exchanger domain-containing protein n=1 Tax=Stylosanthes scabra TaxID=79078 RepID=A0ABU6XIG1_9FABA|nr:hypothetical protein [Stylosanthes scabra]